MVKAPKQDLCFLKTLTCYEKIEKLIFKELWQVLYEKNNVIKLFDDEVDEQTKMKIIINSQMQISG